MAERYPSSSSDDIGDSQEDPELKIDPRNVLKQLKVGTDDGFSLKKWRHLGLELKVPEKKLEQFEIDHPKDVERCLTEAIKHWIDNGKVKWEVLWEALCDSSVSHGDLGRKIKNWYRAKTWRDPRAHQDNKPPRRTYIQMPGRDKMLKAFECSFSNTGFCPPVNPEPNPKKYFRVERQLCAQQRGIYRGHVKGMKSALTDYFSKLVEPHQMKFKTGYEARFGQLYWISESEEKPLQKEGDVYYYTRAYPQRFSTHVTCDIKGLTTAKCHPPKKDHEAFLIDPLKFEIDLPQYKDDVFVAVISDLKENGFQWLEVYQQQKKPLNTSFDFVQPGRKYDFRISDCCALLTKTDDTKVQQIAINITRSIHRGLNDSLSMQLVGKDFHVRFFRQKRQQIYQWKGKEKEKWYLTEFDIDTFEMSDDKLEACKREISESGDDKTHRWPVEFSGRRRKEIELWSRKIFPERYSSSHPTARLYIDPEATGEVLMPHTQAKPATVWTTDELMKDFDEFVQTASGITEFLERAPEI